MSRTAAVRGAVSRNPYGQNEREMLIEQGIPPPAARTVASNDSWLWVFAVAALVIGTVALIWVIVITFHHGHRRCHPQRYEITVVEVDQLSPDPSSAGTLGTTQSVAGFLFDVGSNVVGNTTGSCETSDVYDIGGVTYYMQTCTQVYNFFRDPEGLASDSVTATGQFLANTGGGTFSDFLWAITGGTGKFEGAYGTELVNVSFATELDGYGDDFEILVPCRGARA